MAKNLTIIKKALDGKPFNDITAVKDDITHKPDSEVYHINMPGKMLSHDAVNKLLIAYCISEESKNKVIHFLGTDIELSVDVSKESIQENDPNSYKKLVGFPVDFQLQTKKREEQDRERQSKANEIIEVFKKIEPVIESIQNKIQTAQVQRQTKINIGLDEFKIILEAVEKNILRGDTKNIREIIGSAQQNNRNFIEIEAQVIKNFITQNSALIKTMKDIEKVILDAKSKEENQPGKDIIYSVLYRADTNLVIEIFKKFAEKHKYNGRIFFPLLGDAHFDFVACEISNGEISKIKYIRNNAHANSCGVFTISSIIKYTENSSAKWEEPICANVSNEVALKLRKRYAAIYEIISPSAKPVKYEKIDAESKLDSEDDLISYQAQAIDLLKKYESGSNELGNQAVELLVDFYLKKFFFKGVDFTKDENNQKYQAYKALYSAQLKKEVECLDYDKNGPKRDANGNTIKINKSLNENYQSRLLTEFLFVKPDDLNFSSANRHKLPPEKDVPSFVLLLFRKLVQNIPQFKILFEKGVSSPALSDADLIFRKKDIPLLVDNPLGKLIITKEQEKNGKVEIVTDRTFSTMIEGVIRPAFEKDIQKGFTFNKTDTELDDKTKEIEKRKYLKEAFDQIKKLKDDERNIAKILEIFEITIKDEQKEKFRQIRDLICTQMSEWLKVYLVKKSSTIFEKNNIVSDFLLEMHKKIPQLLEGVNEAKRQNKVKQILIILLEKYKGKALTELKLTIEDAFEIFKDEYLENEYDREEFSVIEQAIINTMSETLQKEVIEEIKNLCTGNRQNVQNSKITKGFLKALRDQYSNILKIENPHKKQKAINDLIEPFEERFKVLYDSKKDEIENLIKQTIKETDKREEEIETLEKELNELKAQQKNDTAMLSNYRKTRGEYKQKSDVIVSKRKAISKAGQDDLIEGPSEEGIRGILARKTPEYEQAQSKRNSWIFVLTACIALTIVGITIISYGAIVGAALGLFMAGLVPLVVSAPMAVVSSVIAYQNHNEMNELGHISPDKSPSSALVPASKGQTVA